MLPDNKTNYNLKLLQEKMSTEWEEASDWEEMFAKDIPDKGLLSKIHKELLKLY